MGILEASTTLVSAAKTAAEAFELYKKLKQKPNDKELLAELGTQIAEIKMKLAEATIENIDLRTELGKREDQKALRAAFIVSGKFYFLKDSLVGYAPGNYCIRCFDENQRMSTVPPGYHCPVCHHSFYKKA